MKDKKDEEILFPEVEVQGYRLRPWSFGELVDLAPEFRMIVQGLRDAGVTFDDIENRLGEVIPLLLPVAPTVISKTIKEDVQAVRAFSPDKATVLLLTILSMNVDHLKNSFGLVMASRKKPAA